MKRITLEQKLIYKTLLPERLSVSIHRAEESGFWVEIKELQGCRTQGENLAELIHMINDAVYGYFNIPVNLMNELGIYMPVKLVRKISAEQIRENPKVTLDDILNSQKISNSSIRSLERVR